MLQPHTVQTCPSPDVAMRAKIVLEPFKAGDFPTQNFALRKEIKETKGSNVAASADSPNTYDLYTPSLTDMDRHPYINLTPAKADWLCAPSGIDIDRESTRLDRHGIQEVMRLVVEADDACYNLFTTMDEVMEGQQVKESSKTLERFYSL